MSKYKCLTCGGNAHYIDFYKKEDDPLPNSVYAYCKKCDKEAWGGLRFHPAMNELFNKLFLSNFEYVPGADAKYSKRIVLQDEAE